MMKNYSDPPSTLWTPLPPIPLVQQTPEVQAELDHMLSGGGFVD